MVEATAPARAMTPATLRPAQCPTLYFVGVTTGHSSIQQVFPLWTRELGLNGARLQGIDLPLHAPTADYCTVVEHIASDPLSLGALVTTHKIDLYHASRDLFDEIDPHARLMGETSCISKRSGRLICHAKDPISSGLAIEAFLSGSNRTGGGRDVLCLGAGGSSIAISCYLSALAVEDGRPARIVITDRSRGRLDHIRDIHSTRADDITFEYVMVDSQEDNDAVLHALADGALVINATGLGKDAPGSPVTDGAVFPRHAIAWDLNYRGDLRFLGHARSQAESRGLQVEDGWIYFVHGWTQVIAEVFDIPIPTSGPMFDRLSDLARRTRG